MREPLFLVLADGHPARGRALAAELALLCAEPVALAVDSRDLLDVARRLRPGVALVDADLPGGPLEVLLPALRSAGAAEVVALGSDDPERVVGLLGAGAAGYLLRGTPGPELLAAARQCASGGSVVSPGLARKLVSRLRPRGTSPLTARERQVLEQVAAGLSNARVALALGLSRATVRTHLEHVYRKLDATNRTEAVGEALRRGFISPPEESR